MDEMKKIATREAYGQVLAALAEENDRIVVLDADLSRLDADCQIR